MAPKGPSITGFDPKKWAASAGHVKNDPWARAEAWRYTGPFTRWNRLKSAFPGLGIAIVAFTGYVVAEQMIFKKEEHAHGEEHH